MSEKYNDIIHLPYPGVGKRPRMSMTDRAAQFSPFAALTGYDAAITESGRLTGRRIELDESEIAQLDSRLLLLCENLTAIPELQATYFVPDEKKVGGQYVSHTGNLKKLDLYNRTLTFSDGVCINMDDVIGLDSPLFRWL